MQKTLNYDLPHSPITTPPSVRHHLACGSFVGLRIETVRFWSGIYLSFFSFALGRLVGLVPVHGICVCFGWDSGPKKKKRKKKTGY
ncbi:hypothetical protein BO85DRAFT_241889 [Aspergillus piperis CBS 112811]|uniref:Uncharacterized protein n=1 Tax=Aspergillus piperis CBS 112811 TaxID=1448313 RepID=A0A8G1QQD2_9EURO|nr:hypothetical protein BO85DRAFT_241889 [Aspergillus piperis CBS 112811]RAH51669.1 hypothetical protein BO85DRAFT_241889 [Aspergillus piperis CBS 112811]